VRILDITDHIPVPTHGGSPLYTYNLLKRVAAEHEVWHVAFTSTPEQQRGIERMRTFCRDVFTLPIGHSRALDQPLDFIRYLVAGKPPDLRFVYSRGLADHIRRLVDTVDFDIVQIEHSEMGQYLDLIPRALWSRAIWMLHDVDWQKFARIARIEPKRARKLRLWLHSQMLRRWIPRHGLQFGCCTAISEGDHRLMLDANPQLHVETIPAGVDTRELQPLPSQDGSLACVFVGNMNYRPNCDAVLYFCREILPQIRQAVPGVEMWIVGITPRDEVKALAGEGVHVTGRVEDVRPFYRQSAVCVLPLRAGGGARLKILEAMALGRPVVSTSVGCEGQDLVNGRHVLIADTPGEFAGQTIRLLCDLTLRQRIAAQARELVVERYDWDISARRLMQIYAGLAGT
jgi:sugar transferase (PEP-CTERM/EpsH1 system associated)